MVCIYCNGELSVTNSRPQKSRNQIWRRRLCKACGAVFTSVEAIDLTQALTVVSGALDAPTGKMSHSLQAFDRDRLYISIYESVRHRPSAVSDARGLADTVVAHIIKNAEHSRVDVRTITQTILDTLQRFDHAAATHYAAFH